MRIAKPVSHQNFERILHFLGSMSVGVSVHPHHTPLLVCWSRLLVMALLFVWARKCAEMNVSASSRYDTHPQTKNSLRFGSYASVIVAAQKNDVTSKDSFAKRENRVVRPKQRLFVLLAGTIRSDLQSDKITR